MYGPGRRGPLARRAVLRMLPIQACQPPWHVRAFAVSPFGSAGPGPGSLARRTHVRQLQLPPDNATHREHHGRLPPVTPGHLGRRRRLIPVSAPSLHSQLKTSNRFLETEVYEKVESWSFLTSHARVLLCIARDPGARLRDIAASLGITERSAYGIVTDLTAVGYVAKQKRRPPQPLPDPGTPPAARNHQPATRHRRSPRPPRGHQRETAGDPDRTSLRPPQLSGVHAPRQTAGAGQPGPPHPTRGPARLEF